MTTPLTRQVDNLVASIKDQIGQHHHNRSVRPYWAVDVHEKTHFFIHHSADEILSFHQMGRFHARPRKRAANGLFLGRGWPGVAYHFGSDDDGIYQAWPVNYYTYHAGKPANTYGVAAVLKGNFEFREPTKDEYLKAVAMKVAADQQIGRRLLIDYHDDAKKRQEGKAYACPGRLFSKKEFQRLEAQYYIDKLYEPDNEPEEENPTKPKPEEPETDTEDPADYPRGEGGENRGCLPHLKNSTMRLLLFAIAVLAAIALKAQNACQTPPINPNLPAELLAEADPTLSYCVDVKIEVGYDIYQDKGANTATWVQGALDQVSAIYEADGITLNWNVHIWDTPDPYTGTSSAQRLYSFRENHLPFDEDVAQYLSYYASGGIAWVDVMCNGNFGFAFSSIQPTYNQYPNYSWTVMVIAHELGHNLGSPHTHACAWNGNQTAIDGCAGSTEGNCPNPGSPAGGGTVMSYCHFTTGIDFNQGFHPQVENLIKNRIAGAACADCDNPPPPPPVDCEENEVIVEIMPDAYPMETSWTIFQGTNEVASGGPYLEDYKAKRWLIQTDSLCLPDGCYRFVIRDFDGLGGQPGGDGLFYVNNGPNTIASGIEFTDSISVDFCLGDGGGCTEVVFDEVLSVGGAQDQGTTEVLPDGALRIIDNGWKGIYLPYEVTPNTVLSFEFMPEIEGEIHGIGFYPSIQSIYFDNTIKVAGTQFWGNTAYQQPYEIGKWVTYEIPIGLYYQSIGKLGEYPYLVFVNDMDNWPKNALAQWRNVEVCEGLSNDLPAYIPAIMGTEVEPINPGGMFDFEGGVYPNPANDTLFLPFTAAYQVFPLNGKRVLSGYDQAINISQLKPGIYAIIYGGEVETFVKQ